VINFIECRKIIEKIIEAKSWFFANNNRNNKPLARLINNKREKTEITNVRFGRGNLTIDCIDIKRIIKAYYEQIYAFKFDKSVEMDNFHK